MSGISSGELGLIVACNNVVIICLVAVIIRARISERRLRERLKAKFEPKE